MQIKFENVSKSYSGSPVLRNVSFVLKANHITCLIGESGSGKTTCLRLMNGLLTPDEGGIWIGETRVTARESGLLRRKMGYCLQGTGLFPHLTVFENVTLVAKLEAYPKGQLRDRCREVLRMVQLDPAEVESKRPNQLSGGQRQRVGIARALFMEPKVMLMDEPFGALDPRTRSEIQDLFLSLQREQELTAVIVTHDLAEAFRLADELVLLDHGEIAQMGEPTNLLLNPQSPLVSDFLRTRSPGHVLKEIELRVVINQNVLATLAKGGSFFALDIRTGTQQEVADMAGLESLHRRQAQQYIYFVSPEGRYEGMASAEQPSQVLKVTPLRTTDHLLLGLDRMIREQAPVLPVVDGQQVFKGCLSGEALRALV